MAAIFEEFANGQDFNASDFNTYSMRQAIIACDNQTDRDSIATPQEGMTVYRKDTDAIEIYDGSAWLTYDTKWQTYTPTLTNLTLGNGTQTAKYFRQGKKITVDWSLVLGTTSSVGSNPEITLPVNRISTGYGTDFDQPVKGDSIFMDQPPGAYKGGVTTSETKFRIYALVTNATYGTLGATSATTPFTFTTGDAVGARFEYIAA